MEKNQKIVFNNNQIQQQKQSKAQKKNNIQKMINNSNNPKNQIYLTGKQLINIYEQYTKNQTNTQSTDPNLILNLAKACFFVKQYELCLKLLSNIKKQKYTPKILFERQSLMLKAHFLTDPENVSRLSEIVNEYQTEQKKYHISTLKQFHRTTLTEMLQVIKKGNYKALQTKQLTPQQIKQKITILDKKIKFQGFPIYLISKQWINKLQEYLYNNGSYPGPITNFQLINHIYQFQPHLQINKQYMNKILFPYLLNTHFDAISRKYWIALEQLFGGYPIKRVSTMNRLKYLQIIDEEDLIKTEIQYQNKKIIMQWQPQTYWHTSVIPTLIKKFGLGQLKIQTYNKDFIVIPPIKIQQPSTLLKYIKIDNTQIITTNIKYLRIKKKIINSYDLEKYNINQWISQRTVGFINQRNICYMNSVLQILSNIKHISTFFLTNQYLSKLNINEKNTTGSLGQVTCAFADVLKRLWFSQNTTQSIDPFILKQVFEKRFPQFQGYTHQDAQQFLIHLLNCMHQDLNDNIHVSISDETARNTGRVSLVNNTIKKYNKHNHSIISDLFNGYLYEQIICTQCGNKILHLNNSFMLHVPVPLNFPKINVLIMRNNCLTQFQQLSVLTNNLSILSQLITLVANHFQISPEYELIPCQYICNQWQILPTNIDINSMLSGNPYMFMYEIKKSQSDEEQIIRISYLYKNDQLNISEHDGHPRLLCIKKIPKNERQSEQKINKLINTTMPQKILEKWKHGQNNFIFYKQITDKYYTSEYQVWSKDKLANYNCTQLNKVLSIDNSKDETKLQDIFDKMNTQEIINLEIGWNCQKCDQVRAANKTEKIYSLGKYFIIHFKRFTEIGGKITTKIEYPFKLNMQPYIHNDINDNEDIIPQHQGSFNNLLKNKKINIQQNYTLYGVILHTGTLNSGHYSCFCRSGNTQKWFYYSDQNIHEITNQNYIIHQNAYILIYQKDGKGNAGTVKQEKKKI